MKGQGPHRLASDFSVSHETVRTVLWAAQLPRGDSSSARLILRA
jgi:hypothetical protein